MREDRGHNLLLDQSSSWPGLVMSGDTFLGIKHEWPFLLGFNLCNDWAVTSISSFRDCLVPIVERAFTSVIYV